MLNTDTEIQIKTADNLVGITQIRESKENHWNSQGIKINLIQAVEVHLSEVVNKHTQRAKRIDLFQFIQFLSGNGIRTIGDLGKLIAPELKTICESFLDGLNLTKATLQRKRASIKVWFDFLSFNFPKLITFVPKLNSEKYKLVRNKGITPALDLEQWFRLKQELGKSKKNPRLLVLCQCALLLGGRRISELLNLKWQDVDFINQTVMIKPSKKGPDETIHQLPLTPQLKCVLQEYLESLDNVGIEDKIFPVTQQSIDESLKRYARKAKIGRISFHSLRSTFITWANQRGDTQSEILNATLHKSTQMIRYYDQTSQIEINSINKMGMV